jgi:hypothetical protein
VDASNGIVFSDDSVENSPLGYVLFDLFFTGFVCLFVQVRAEKFVKRPFEKMEIMNDRWLMLAIRESSRPSMYICRSLKTFFCLRSRSAMRSLDIGRSHGTLFARERDDWASTEISRMEIDESKLLSRIVPGFVEWMGAV